MSRDVGLYLEYIVACCEKVLRYTAGMQLEQFAAEERTLDAVLRNLEVIGEAAKRVPQAMRDAQPGTPCKIIAANATPQRCRRPWR